MSPLEQALGGLMASAVLSVFLIAIIASGLHFFVALNSPPQQRALWTVGPAYFLCSIIGAFPDNGPFPFWVWPIGAIPGAAIWYWFWLRDFQKRWYASFEDIPDDIPVANHDWKAGLLLLLATMMASFFVAMSRHAF